ncbi:aminoglycoside phosphotransferase family protein [Streptomyces sp. B1866]|nr:aminoglycoside phosphotransferase family protein [Streptomyces sp. B1866]
MTAPASARPGAACRPALTRAQLARFVARALGPGTTVVSARELTDPASGTRNATWLLTPDRDGPVVLKAGPPPGTPLPAHEAGALRTEALFLELAAGAAPVPALRHAGCDGGPPGGGHGDVIVVSALPGTSWHRVRDRLPAPERRRLRYELGGLVAGLHRVRGPWFGPLRPGAPRCGSWPDAYAAMLDAALADADRFGAALPAPPEAMRARAAAGRAALAEVAEPALVHFDLWEGNILVDGTGGPGDDQPPERPRVTGLVDGERAFWGDPHADFASLALFGGIEADDAFLAGYRAAGGRADLTPGLRHRLALYRLHLYVAMLTEQAARGVDGPAHRAVAALCRRRLLGALRALRRAGEADR